MKKILALLILAVSFTACEVGEVNTNLLFKDCSDPVRKVSILLDTKSTDWIETQKFNGNKRYVYLKHASGVELIRTYKKPWLHYEWDESEIVDLGWTFSKPTKLKLTDSENLVINESYGVWSDSETNRARCDISEALGVVKVEINSK